MNDKDPKETQALEDPDSFGESAFWTEENLGIFENYSDGRTIAQIATSFNKTRRQVLNVVTNPVFTGKYTEIVNQVLDNFQYRKYKVLNELLSELFKKVKKGLKEVSPTESLRELRKLLIDSESTKTYIDNRKLSLTVPKKPEDIKKGYGFRELQPNNPDLASGESSRDK